MNECGGHAIWDAQRPALGLDNVLGIAEIDEMRQRSRGIEWAIALDGEPIGLRFASRQWHAVYGDDQAIELKPVELTERGDDRFVRCRDMCALNHQLLVKGNDHRVVNAQDIAHTDHAPHRSGRERHCRLRYQPGVGIPFEPCVRLFFESIGDQPYARECQNLGAGMALIEAVAMHSSKMCGHKIFLFDRQSAAYAVQAASSRTSASRSNLSRSPCRRESRSQEVIAELTAS